MPFTFSNSTCLIVGLILVFCVPSAVAAPPQPLYIGCRTGQAPYNDVVPFASAFPNSTVLDAACDGYLPAVWREVAARLPANRYAISYGVVNANNIDSFLTNAGANKGLGFPATGNSDYYDAIIAFHSVTTARLQKYDFTAAVDRTDYTIVLGGAAASSTSLGATSALADVVFRPAVFVIFGAMVSVSLALTIVLFAVEVWWGRPRESAVLRQPDGAPYWHRLLSAFECAFEAILTGQTTSPLSTQIATSLRTLVGMSSVLFIAIFGSVMTSRLTQASLSQGGVPLSSLRNLRIATSSDNLAAFVQTKLSGCTAYSVPNLDPFAAAWFQYPAYQSVDGYITATAVALYLQNQYNSGSGGTFVATVPFTLTGTDDIRGIPVSRNAPSTFKDDFNIALLHLREAGVTSMLKAQYVQGATGPSGGGDIPIDASSFYGLLAFDVAFVGVALLWCGYLFFYGRRVVAASAGDDAQWQQQASPAIGVKEGVLQRGAAVDAGGAMLRWRGRAFALVPADLSTVIDAIVASLRRTR